MIALSSASPFERATWLRAQCHIWIEPPTGLLSCPPSMNCDDWAGYEFRMLSVAENSAHLARIIQT